MKGASKKTANRARKTARMSSVKWVRGILVLLLSWMQVASGAPINGREFQKLSRGLVNKLVLDAATTEVWTAISLAQNGDEFYRLVETRVPSRERVYLKRFFRTFKTWPQASRVGNVWQFRFTNKDEIKIEVLDHSGREYRIDGIRWSLNPQVPLESQLNSFQKILKKRSEVSKWRWLVPEAQALEPVSIVLGAAISMVVGIILTTVLEPIKVFSSPAIYRTACKWFVDDSTPARLEASLKDYPPCAGYIQLKREQEPGTKVIAELPDKASQLKGVVLVWDKCPGANDVANLEVRLPGHSITQQVKMKRGKDNRAIAETMVSVYKKVKKGDELVPDAQMPDPILYQFNDDGGVSCIVPVDEKGEPKTGVAVAQAKETTILKGKLCMADLLDEKHAKPSEREELKKLFLQLVADVRWSKTVIDNCSDPELVNKIRDPSAATPASTVVDRKVEAGKPLEEVKGKFDQQKIGQ